MLKTIPDCELEAAKGGELIDRVCAHPILAAAIAGYWSGDSVRAAVSGFAIGAYCADRKGK